MSAARSPHLRHLRATVYLQILLIAGATVVGSFIDKKWDGGAGLLEATLFLGLEALGLLLASRAIGPLTAVFPRVPFRARLQLARRAVGVAAYLLAGLHAMLYLAPALLRDWHELLDPGCSWTVGLALGAAASTALLALAVTSRDAAVRSMGGRCSKRLRAVHLDHPTNGTTASPATPWPARRRIGSQRANCQAPGRGACTSDHSSQDAAASQFALSSAPPSCVR